MREFASTAMIRVLLWGLKRQGLAPPPTPGTGAAHIPRADKRAILENVTRNHGPLALLRATDGIADIPMEPLLRVMVAARDVPDLLDRWHRLERFAHSRHRVRFAVSARDAAVLEHTAPGHPDPPSWEESLVVFGVLVNLCERIGAREVIAGPVSDDGSVDVWRENGFWSRADRAVGGRPWRIAWSPPSAARPQPPPIDEAEAPAARLRAVVRADPARRWRVREAAKGLAMSARNLQRRLADDGTSLTKVVLEERLALATGFMEERGMGLAQIGFLCGFSDQAHFSRMFKRATGMTPAVYERILTRAD